MQPITNALTLGQTGDNIANLQEALMYFISNNVLGISDDHLINGLAEEYATRLFGHNTAALVHSYQLQYGLPSDTVPVLNEATFNSMNALVEQLASTNVRLSGTIRFPAGSAIAPPFTITLQRATFSAPEVVGTQTSNDGSYAFLFQSADAAAGKAKGYQIIAVDHAGRTYSSVLSYLQGTNLSLDIIPEPGDIAIISEYEDVYNALIAALGNQALGTVNPDDEAIIQHLIAEAGEPEDNVRQMIRAAKLASATAGNVAVIYGLLRQGLSSSAESLLMQPGDYLRRALTIAVSGNIIPHINGVAIAEAVAMLFNVLTAYVVQGATGQSPELSATFRMLQGVFNYSNAAAINVAGSAQLTREFMQQYFSLENNENGVSFWQGLEENGDFGPYAKDLNAVVTLGILTGNNPALVYRLLHLIKGEPLSHDPQIAGSMENPLPKSLALLDSGDWQVIITNARQEDGANFFYPPYVIGENSTAKDSDYAKRMVKLTAHSFPTQAIASKVSAAGGDTPFIELNKDIDTFLTNNPDFDFRSTPATEDHLDLSGISDQNAFLSEVGTVQRLMNLTPDYDHIAAMAKKGFTSSIQIAQSLQGDFVSKMGGAIDSATANTYYRTAKGVADFNLTLVIEKYKDFNGLDLQPQLIDTDWYNPDSAYAEWRTLFGSLDGCDCCHCQSVYSPSAYMTDLLRFLYNLPNGADIHNELVNNRRPDLPHIELTCKNANTPVPQIDIANELLEDLVASNGAYKMYARQTGADAAMQRAIPEHVNTSGVTLNTWNSAANSYSTPVTLNTPYLKLKAATYPWSLPYNFYKRQIDEHLELNGAKGYEIVQRFSGNDALAAWDDYAFCTEYIGISKDEADLLTTDPSVATNYLPPLYGFKISGSSIAPIPDPAQRGSSIGGINTTNWIGVLASRVDVFLQQTGLAYAELLQLLDCYFINPLNGAGATTRKMEILSKPGKDYDTCRLDELEISGMDLNVLYLLYRFVRLKRALGWTYYDLDRIVLAMGITSSYMLAGAAWLDRTTSNGRQHYCQLAQFRYVIKTLGLSPEQAAAIRVGIDEIPYRNYDKSEPADIPNLYERIFRNPALFDVKAPGYPFKNVASANTAEARDVLVNYLSGILNVSGVTIQKLIDDLATGTGPVVPDLTLLSSIYREVLLIKSLKLSADDWSVYKRRLINTTGFGTDGTELYDKHIDFAQFYPPQMIRLISLVRTVQSSGISAADVDYLLQDMPVSQGTDEQLNASFATMLTTLRAALKQKWSPAYSIMNDYDGKVLLGLLTSLSDADKAAKLIGIVQGTAALGTGYTVADAQTVVNSTFGFLLPAGSDGRLIDTVNATTFLNTAQDRRAYVFGQMNKYVLEPFIISFFSKEMKLSEELVRTILENCILFPAATSGQAHNGLQAFAQQEFIGDLTEIDRWGGSGTFFATPFKSLLLLYKAALLTTRLGMSSDDVSYFWKDAAVFTDVLNLSDLPMRSNPVMQPLSAPFRKLNVLLRWIKVSAFLGEQTGLLYEGLKSLITTLPAPANVPATLLNIISAAFKTGSSDVAVLLGDGGITNNGILNVWQPLSYEQPQLYLRIVDALEMQHLLPAPMQALVKVAGAIHTAANQQDANEIIRIIKAQYNDNQWLEVIRPANDVLRKERRDALVAYLIANPPAGYEYKWRTDNDIFETLMLDVEMNPCMSTTRVLMGINTIQLWVDRVLLGLERIGSPAYVLRMDKDSKRQWDSWRKRYRIWEANRKIFIYPENWIEPDLRDGKTPLFIELEKFLKQNEVTDENVEAAYKTYLERLDEIAHLDIIGIYRETTQEDYSSFMYFSDVTRHDVVHAFGRTPAHPHIYYYRKRVADEWTPWEKMDVQIDGDHFVPVMWRGRLRFYWLTFMKEQLADAGNKMRSSKEDYVTPASTRWKINIAWTELKNGRWTAKEVSKEALYSFPIEEENLISWNHLDFFRQRGWANKEVRAWYPAGTLDRQQRERFYFNSAMDSDGNLTFDVFEKIVRNSCPRLEWHLYNYGNGFPSISPRSDKDIPAALALVDSDEKYNDRFPIGTGSFTVKFNGVKAMTTPFPPVSLYQPFNWSPTYDSGSLEGSSYLGIHTDYHYDRNPNQGYAHFPDNKIQLLDQAPDTSWPDERDDKYLVFPRNLPAGYWPVSKIEIPYFFYKDFKNTYFVEKIHEVGTYTGRTLQFEPVHEGPDVYLASDRGFGFGEDIRRTGSDDGFMVLENDQGHDNADFGGGVVWSSTYYITKYRFHNFRHERVNAFRKVLHEEGLDGLLNRQFIHDLNANDDMLFKSRYVPTVNVLAGNTEELYPYNNVDFRYDAAYSAYNWELFFHIPMLIASRLSQNQQFEEARKWHHYIFNPTFAGPVGAPPATNADFWNVEQFYNEAFSIPTIKQIMQDANLQAAVARWAADPFKPHLVARTRISAYMKNTVMKYIDNLIAWGDALFRTDSHENIVEATLLYVLVAQLLGRKPATIPARAKPIAQTYATMQATGKWNAFANALVKIESIMLASGAKPTSAQLPVGADMYYFCIPPNEKLTAYWDIIADRLFKIRNCRSIDGVERDLALYDPPIDPALLVKAAASGVSVADAIAGLSAPMPHYRFNVLSQKATELAGEVKALGGQLLSALEKKDAEHLALLRSSQEQKVLDAVTEQKEQGIEEAVAQINGLQQQQTITTQRRDHYAGLIDRGWNSEEQLQLESLQNSIPLAIAKGASQMLASGMFAFPEVHIGAFNFGIRFGGMNLGHLNSIAAAALDTASSINSTKGSMAATKGSFARRKEDWELQLKLANAEINQIDKQIIAAQIRQAMAEHELKNHKLQISNAQEMDEAMRGKYTNEELYDWMIGQISFSYIAAYKMAYDMARRAERCYSYELALPLASFIGYEYWDSLRKGLMAGEQLVYDIKRMEVSYIEKNKRSLELTKHVSLATLDPDALMLLKRTKNCSVQIPEWLYDLDYPGQHMRRIKSVSVSIPCVAGPYTTVSCKLSLLSSKYRKEAEVIDGFEFGPFETSFGNIQSIATSHAQNDTGMFDFSFRDERYLPFEGAGAISEWAIELPAAYAQFDYDSIADVILHINYTALDEGALKGAAIDNVATKMSEFAESEGFYRIFDLKHEFPNEWHTMLHGSNKTMVLQNLKQRLPYLVQPMDVAVAEASFLVERSADSSGFSGLALHLENSLNSDDITSYSTLPVDDRATRNIWASFDASIALDLAGDWTLSATEGSSAITDGSLSNIYLLLRYTAAMP